MADVLVAGHVNWDVTLLVDHLPAADEEAAIRERHSGGGGSAANVAVGLTGLGVATRLLGSVGDDEPGAALLSDLADRGVDVDGVRTVPGATSTKQLLVADEDVAILGNDGVNEALDPTDVGPADLAGAEHVHVTGQCQALADRLVTLAVEADCTVSLDPGRRAGERGFDRLLDRADLVFGTDREIEALLETAGGDLANPGTDARLVATSGAGGARCVGPDPVAEPGFDVDVADTAGAGDAFVAGFLSVWLEEDEADARALEVGNACGAIASQQVGARCDLDAAKLASLLE